MAKRARAISAVFRDQPHVRDSRVAFTSFLERRWYLNTEGTSAHDTRRVSGVLIVATSQAADGQELALYYTRYGHTADDLPGDAELTAEAKKLARTLAELRAAPVMDNYTGPVLFEGEGAAGVVRYTLTSHLSGTPLPEGLSAAESKHMGGGLSERIGLRVLSPLLTVIDDPTAKRAGKTPVIGSYKFDDEGVPAQRVTVVDSGKLEALLMSRTPARKTDASNGHARRAAPGGVYHGSSTNLFVQGKQGLSRARLVARLLGQAKEQGLPYALIIRRFDDAAATAAPELSTRELFHMFKTTDPEAPPMALLAYKVYPNGREELVRGVQLRPVSLRAWRDVIAVGDTPTVSNYLASGQHPIEHKLTSVGEGSVPSSGVESAIVTPNLLFKELDVMGSTAGRRSEPAVPRPATK
jgi:TldD protein